MTGRERLLAAIRGEQVDRPPIWLREGFNIGGDLLAEPMQDVLGGGADQEFLLGWKRDALYRELFEYVSPHVDVMRSWSVNGFLNRFLLIPPECIHRESKQVDDDTIRVDGWVETQKRRLTFCDEIKRGINTYWQIDHMAESAADLEELLEIPFHFDQKSVEPFIGEFEARQRELGDRGIMRIDYPSPIVAISANLSLENFLALSIMEKDLFHRLLEEITSRLLTVTDAIFADRDIDTLVNLGGSEQCTPPLMAPEAFDEYVVPYDGRIIRRLKEYGLPVNMHCHGQVRHALRCMVEMGVDSSDPVEPPPAGNVTYAEARKIVQDGLTIVGNLEFDELENSHPGLIRERVREILSLGKERLILGASAGPINAVTPRLVENYKAWIDTYLEFYNS